MIHYDRPYIKDHFLYDCSTAACTFTTIATGSTSITDVRLDKLLRRHASYGSDSASSPDTCSTPRAIKGPPRRKDIGPFEIEQIEHVKLDCRLDYVALTGRGIAKRGIMTMERDRISRDKERECASADEGDERDGRRSPTRVSLLWHRVANVKPAVRPRYEADNGRES